jgi:topoisomerase-4 subunit A
MISSTRKGRAVLNVDAPAMACVITPAVGDHVATIGENRKMLVFPLAQTPEMARGKGVRLQRFKDGGLADARVFALADGLTWRDSAGRTFTVGRADLKEWIGNRAEAGRLPPKGFPRSNKF